MGSFYIVSPNAAARVTDTAYAAWFHLLMLGVFAGTSQAHQWLNDIEEIMRLLVLFPVC